MIVGNLGAQKEKRNDTPISAKKDIMGDKTVRVRADLHHIIKIETAKNGGNVKEVMEIRLRSKLKSVLIVLLKFCIIGIEVKLDAKNL
ncbi:MULTISPECIES: peptide-binding protein [Enterococcus]|uniref:peptide-binding protein n=1 Tax=Enterococcus TaxID=1350 RepID=UPI0032657E58